MQKMVSIPLAFAYSEKVRHFSLNLKINCIVNMCTKTYLSTDNCALCND